MSQVSHSLSQEGEPELVNCDVHHCVYRLGIYHDDLLFFFPGTTVSSTLILQDNTNQQTHKPHIIVLFTNQYSVIVIIIILWVDMEVVNIHIVCSALLRFLFISIR